MPTSFTIPADGSSVAAKGFPNAASAALASLTANDQEQAMATAAAAAAITLVEDGHAGSENVWAAISVHSNPRHDPLSAETTVSIAIHQRSKGGASNV